MAKRIGLYWFTNDLRLQDNLALAKANKECDQLLLVYILDPKDIKANRYGFVSLGSNRLGFLAETLADLSRSIKQLGQNLQIIQQNPIATIAQLITIYNIDAVYRSENSGFYENHYWKMLQQQYEQLEFIEHPTHTLFSLEQLPYSLSEIPTVYTEFRKRVESQTPNTPAINIEHLKPEPKSSFKFLKPDFPTLLNNYLDPTIQLSQSTRIASGGETQATQHITRYFSSNAIAHYKISKNAINNIRGSSKFSPWLANGSLSVHQVLRCLKKYDDDHANPESTKAIKFELLWREYNHWLARSVGIKLFSLGGIRNKRPLTPYYAQRLRSWTNGTTPFPIVNACIKQLNTTGYLSNTGRKIAASALVNELNLDWRFGAAYFEHQLLDYDVAVNWCNWQNAAGVGVDPRTKLTLNLDEQQRLYDPNGEYIKYWQGETSVSTLASLDTVDLADWPLE
jgi:deoxyribodipyrimidine photo-lyase